MNFGLPALNLTLPACGGRGEGSEMQIAAEGKDDIRGRGAGIARSAVGADAARAGVFAGRSGELFYNQALRLR